MAWRTATGDDGPEFSERPGPQPTAQASAAPLGPETSPRPSHTKPRSGARVREGRQRGTAVANAIKPLRAIAKVINRLINVSPVVKDLKRP
ncbi:MAG: hypothetical protein QOC58_1447 [Mycobacterium sp.]|nr:hypothetical protein [Mycobacterium sp.]